MDQTAPMRNSSGKGSSAKGARAPVLNSTSVTARAQLEYTHREEIHGLSLANDAVTLQLQLSL